MWTDQYLVNDYASDIQLLGINKFDYFDILVIRIVNDMLQKSCLFVLPRGLDSERFTGKQMCKAEVLYIVVNKLNILVGE